MMEKERAERFETAKETLDVFKNLKRDLQAEAEGGRGFSITKKIKTMILRRDE